MAREWPLRSEPRTHARTRHSLHARHLRNRSTCQPPTALRCTRGATRTMSVAAARLPLTQTSHDECVTASGVNGQSLDRGCGRAPRGWRSRCSPASRWRRVRRPRRAQTCFGRRLSHKDSACERHTKQSLSEPPDRPVAGREAPYAENRMGRPRGFGDRSQQNTTSGICATASADTRALAFRLASSASVRREFGVPRAVIPSTAAAWDTRHKLTPASSASGLETADGRKAPPTALVASLLLVRLHQFVEP
jgi:hypothetical protein